MHQVWPGASDVLFSISWFSIPPETLAVRHASPCPAGMFISKVPWVFVLVCLLVWDSIHLGRDLCRFSWRFLIITGGGGACHHKLQTPEGQRTSFGTQFFLFSVWIQESARVVRPGSKCHTRWAIWLAPISYFQFHFYYLQLCGGSSLFSNNLALLFKFPSVPCVGFSEFFPVLLFILASFRLE